MVACDDLKSLIDKHFESDFDNSEYDVVEIDPRKLLTSNRLDVAIKVLFLEMLKYKIQHSEDLYLEHVRAFSLGAFSEPGNDEKCSPQNYLDDFIKLYKSIKKDGFDTSKSLIPCANDLTIANGSHRVASSILENRKVSCVKLSTGSHCYDYNFFYGRGYKKEYIEEAVNKFIELADNSYVALIWPSATGESAQLDGLLENVIYRTEVDLNYNGAKNLLSQVYYGESWLGSFSDGFRGVDAKLVECFKGKGALKVVAFQCDYLDNVKLLKEKIREVFGIGKHSVHITDTHNEAIRLSRVLFNKNGLHFLNYGHPTKFKSTLKKLETIRDFLSINSIDENEVVFDGSVVMSLYGMRECRDIDCLSVNEYPGFDVDFHDDELKHHDVDKYELLFNPKYYFYYDNIKFISFSQLRSMKLNRSELKDQNDVLMMESYVNNDRVNKIITKVIQKLLYSKAKSRSMVINFLKAIGVHKQAKSIYQYLKNK